MIVYCAFLRGINVGGNKMDMKELTQVFKAMGFLDAVTVLGTGNVVFSAKSDPKALKLLIESRLSAHFSYDAHIFLRNSFQLKEVLDRAALYPVPEDYHQYFLLCDDLNAIVALNQYFKSAQHAEHESLVTLDNGLLWQVPQGQTLRSDFGKEALGRKYTTSLTSRNIHTLEKAYSLMKTEK